MIFEFVFSPTTQNDHRGLFVTKNEITLCKCNKNVFSTHLYSPHFLRRQIQLIVLVVTFGTLKSSNILLTVSNGSILTKTPKFI